MSGTGDIGGEVSGEEAAWRDLIARFDSPGGPAADAAPWPAREDLPDTGVSTDLADPGTSTELPGAGFSPELPGAGFSPELPAAPAEPGQRTADERSPADRTRIIRPAGDPRSYSPAEEEDEPYVPAPLPPPAKLDPVSKGAWAALICGPGYLLLGTLLGWTISGTEALAAIAAFVAGFVILVVRMSDHPPRDDDDDGAVL
jgi:hypothetical protein